MARWSGRALDPAVVAVFADAPGELLAMSSPDDLWAAVVDAEPVPRRAFRGEAALEEALVFIRYAFTVTATGKQVTMNMHHYWRFRDGTVCFVRSSEDTAQVAAALTP